MRTTWTQSDLIEKPNSIIINTSQQRIAQNHLSYVNETNPEKSEKRNKLDYARIFLITVNLEENGCLTDEQQTPNRTDRFSPPLYLPVTSSTAIIAFKYRNNSKNATATAFIDLAAILQRFFRRCRPRHNNQTNNNSLLVVQLQFDKLEHCQSNNNKNNNIRRLNESWCHTHVTDAAAAAIINNDDWRRRCGRHSNILAPSPSSSIQLSIGRIVFEMHSQDDAFGNELALVRIDSDHNYRNVQNPKRENHFASVTKRTNRRSPNGDYNWFQMIIWLLSNYETTISSLKFTANSLRELTVATDDNMHTLLLLLLPSAMLRNNNNNNSNNTSSLSSSIQANYYYYYYYYFNALKTKFHFLQASICGGRRRDIDMSILYSSMSLIIKLITTMLKKNVHNKFNNLTNPSEHCASSGPMDSETHVSRSTLRDQPTKNPKRLEDFSPLQEASLPRQLQEEEQPLPQPTIPLALQPSLSPSSYSCNFIVTRFPSDKFVTNNINFNNTNNYNNNNNNQKAKINKTNNNRSGEPKSGSGRSTRTAAPKTPAADQRSRQLRCRSKVTFAHLSSLYIDFRKMFTTLLLPMILLCNLMQISCAECDQTFVSRPGGPQNGTFTAPVISNLSNHSRQCLYIFLAGPGQRVEITFTSFNLRGSPPDGAAVGEIPSCGAEYMDIYSEVQSSDPADLINSPFGGRYCGPNLPRRRISLYRAIALSFFTSKNATEADLFTGYYSFINASIFEIGTPITGSPCSFTITPHKNKSDVFISPTYPGTYPKDMFCTYHFIGESNQRVRLEFRDFDLFFGGPHCPFDFVKVYDGPDNSSELIGTYCGQQRNLVLYSSESSLLVHFFTLRRTASTQNRGFKGIYEFSEGFVKLDFIRLNNGMHIRGTECDQKILSKRESTGLVYSPNYPFPYLPKTVCRYFIYGLQDAQHLERVRLEFQMFEIQKGEHKADKETNCTDGYLKIFLKGQETQDAYDKFDYELCGFDIPHYVVSDGPRLAMVFSSGELQARGFKAKYTFETEYKIPGTAAPDGSCSFTYKSTSRKKGEFNSPRFPSKYISDTNCTYMFFATPNEQVTIVFDHFKVKADNANVTGGAYGTLACSEDWLEIYVLFRDGNDRFIGRYCGNTAPGPVESPRGAIGIRIQLHTDAENVSSGFKGRYIFEVAKSVTGDCGGNYSGQESDIITSPNYPGKYDGPGKGLASRACNWYINSRYGFRVSMNFEFFSVEGDPPSRGCPAAALRIWTAPDTDQAPIELCGDKPSSDPWHYISQGQNARISFITTDKTIGAQGFRIVWTEVQDTTQLTGPPSSIVHHCEPTYLFHCASSGYCISNKLRCDDVKNCGPADDSDETNCITEVTKDESEILIISSLAAASFLICLVCTVYHRRKRRKHHHRQLGLHRSGGHYDSTTSATGLGSSRRHLQSSGSLHYGINSDDDILPIPIPQPPLPPTSVPPHLNHLIINCTEDMQDDEDDDDDDEEEIDLDSEQASHLHQHDVILTPKLSNPRLNQM